MDLPEMVLADGSTIIPIHFSVMVDGEERVVCLPNLRELHANKHRLTPIMRSGDPGAVNCPYCKQTPQHKGAMAIWR